MSLTSSSSGSVTSYMLLTQLRSSSSGSLRSIQTGSSLSRSSRFSMCAWLRRPLRKTNTLIMCTPGHAIYADTHAGANGMASPAEAILQSVNSGKTQYETAGLRLPARKRRATHEEEGLTRGLATWSLADDKQVFTRTTQLGSPQMKTAQVY